jgi:HAD superfamily hydrolase (TIGR01509 family)
MKPGPEIYEAAVEAAGCEASECFFVDDLVENVEAARAAGLLGALYVGVEPLKVALKDAGVRAACESV